MLSGRLEQEHLPRLSCDQHVRSKGLGAVKEVTPGTVLKGKQKLPKQSRKKRESGKGKKQVQNSVLVHPSIFSYLQGPHDFKVYGGPKPKTKSHKGYIKYEGG